MFLNKINKINIFAILLTFFSILYFYNLFLIYQNFYSLNTSGLLLINYDGGFLRRALLGEIITSLSLLLTIEVKKVFILFYIINYLIFFYLNYLFFKKLKQNYIFYFFIFSPIFLTFPLSDVSSKYAEFLIQRESFLICFFLVFCYFCKSLNDRRLVYAIGLIISIFLTFLYELTILCYPFFFFAYYIFLKRKKLNINFFELIFAVIILMFIIFLHIHLYGNNNFEIVIKNLNTNFGFNFSKDNFIFSWLNKDVGEQITYLLPDFKSSYIFKYILYSHPIILLIFISYRNFNDNIALSLILLSVLSFTIVFGIAIDWARFVYILYCFTLYSVILFLSENKNLFIELSKNNFLSKFNYKVLNFFVFFYCTIWTLKHTYWQNHLSYGIFKILKKNFLYLN